MTSNKNVKKTSALKHLFQYSPLRFFLFFGTDDAVEDDDLDAVRFTPRAAGISACNIEINKH